MTGEAGLAGGLARRFLDSKLTPLLAAGAVALGFLALSATPREEEPQIRVPMVDVQAALPGAPPREVERRLADPIEKAVWGIPGVEHVYSTSRTGGVLVTVRFRVNESNEDSLVKVSERLAGAARELPAEAPTPVVQLHSIDDVPFLTLTLTGGGLSPFELRALGVELAQELAEVPDTARVTVTGGQPRAVRIEADADRLAAAGVTWPELASSLRGASRRVPAGSSVAGNRETRVEAGFLFRDGAEVARAVVAARDGGPVTVGDVADVLDGPDEVTDYVFFGEPGRPETPAVTVSLAKRAGTNATALAERVLEKVESLRARLLPEAVRVVVTRNYGETADEKSNELVRHLLLATLSVSILIALAMGWRSAAVVAIAVPVTLALTLFVYFLFGYTLNRVTLFALIFSIGILVDDAIVVVENIERHHRERPSEPLRAVAVRAVAEVGNPTILATFTVIAAILPMAFVRGLMGPYMRPIPTGASAAMVFSLVVAFVVSPWAAIRIFRTARPAAHAETKPEGRATRLYRRVMAALLERPPVRRLFFAGVGLLFALAVGTVLVGLVRVKMLPFDNKSELQVLVDHPEGTPLEQTLETARAMARALSVEPEVRDWQIYAGAPAPFNFNGLVRHYFLRREPHRADLQVNLLPRGERSAQSHDIARRVRPGLAAIARGRGARVKVVEIPPGPPVLSTLVAEIYGPNGESRERVASRVLGFFESTPGVVDADWTLEAARPARLLRLDAEEATLHGVAPAAALAAVSGAGEGEVVGRLDLPRSREPILLRLRLSAADRARPDSLLALRVRSVTGEAVPLAEIAGFVEVPEPQPILHKDLKPVVYVLGDLAGKKESPVYALRDLNRRLDAEGIQRFAIAAPETSDRPALKWDGEWQITYEVFRDLGIAFAAVLGDLAGKKESPVYALRDLNRRLDAEGIPRFAIAAPETSDRAAVKWDGEWQITYEVFRDLGMAFAAVLVLITLLVIAWFQSFRTPLAILLPIPLSLIGILPGHLLFGAFFTATSMIGFIAGAGIIVRNSIILVDFIELKARQGMPLEQAVVEAGAVRFRPMLLTAAAVAVGSAVILFDPIFQGLAISLMMGEVAATFLSRLTVPVLYYLLVRGRAPAELATAA